MNAVPPFPRTILPSGAETLWYGAEGDAEGADRLRAVRWAARGGVRDGARGHVLFAGGKRDFIERHAETYHRLLAAGYGVTAIDWRDQDLSPRRSVSDERLFDEMEADFAAIFALTRKAARGPLILMGHSMGGHMMLRALARRAEVRANTEKGVLFAPMLGIGRGRGAPPAWLLSALARLQVRLGRGRAYPPGQMAYGPGFRSEVRRERLTGDRARFDEGFGWIEAEPGLSAGGATWGWLAAAARSMARLRAPGMLERIEVPLLMLVGTGERVVDPSSIARAAARMPHAHVEVVEGGRHELQLESDSVQARFWPLVMDFLA